MPWPEQIIHFVDFEGGAGCGILEFGVVSVRAGRIEQARGRLCAPSGTIPRDDIPVHGLTAAALAGAASVRDEWAYFVGLRETGPFAAHFAGTENSLLKAVWPQTRPAPDFVAGAGRTTTEWGPWIDTARLYAQLLPAGHALGLREVIAAAGLQTALDDAAGQHCPPGRRQFHAALYDALAGALLVARLAGQARYRDVSVGQLLLASTQDADRRRAMTQPELF